MTDIAFRNAHDGEQNVTWFEFVLDEEKLLTHLQSEDPDPSGTSLIKTFFEQANKPPSDQSQNLNNNRNQLLKRLALETAAYLKWDLNLFEKELPISFRHQLLRELLTFCKIPIFPDPELDVKSQIGAMHDHTIMALMLYCRWAARTVVKSGFHVKPRGRTTPTVPPPGLYQANAQQRCEELKEQIVNIVKNQCFDIVQTLEAFLQQVKRPVHVPNYECIKQNELCSTEKTQGWLVSCEELHAQVCYDLGCLHFMHSFHDKAYEMFHHVFEWLNCFPEERTGYCDISEATLKGYFTACQQLNSQEKVPEAEASDNLYTRLSSSLKDKDGLREIGEILMEDIRMQELSMPFREQVEHDLMHRNKENFNVDIHFEVVWSNAICRAVRGYSQPTCFWTYEMNIAQLQRILGMVQQTYSYVTRKERKKLGGFLHSLFNNLSKPELQQQLLQCEIAENCLSETELLLMKQSAAMPSLYDPVLTQDSPDSPDSSLTGTALITGLEADLITSFNPEFLKETLVKLHKMSPDAQNYKICDNWEVNPEYETILRSISVSVSKDLMYILLAKVNQCLVDKDSYATAKRLLTYIQENGKSLSFKLQKIAVNELLKVELWELLNDPTLTFASEEICQDLREQLSDIFKRAKQFLLTRSSDVVPAPPELTELCIALFVNLEDFAFIESVSHQVKDNQMRFAKKLLKVRSKIASAQHPSELKKPVNELWNTVTNIFASSITRQKRSQDGVTVITKLPDAPSPLITRPVFLSLFRKIRNQNVLQITISLLVALHRLCQEDILVDIKVPLSDIWPASMGNGKHSVSAPCLSDALKSILSHCLAIQPHNLCWLRTQADFDFAYCNYSSAFKNYLKLGAVQTNFFNGPNVGIFTQDNQVIQRMVKCCLQMKCNTQAAVLCQMMKEVDYSTAFKALQESRERADAMEIHYREHFWDVELLEYATCMHRNSGEVAKKESALRALADPDLNRCNVPKVLSDVSNIKTQKFFRTLVRQYLS